MPLAISKIDAWRGD